MKKILLICFLFLLFIESGFSADSKKGKKEICISFDELPAASGFVEVDRQAVSYLILQALDKYEVKAIGFVIGNQIEESFDILGEWLNKGHQLGNMTYSNSDLDQLGIEQFIEDIKAGDKALDVMLSGFGQKKKYFRYPYLHYGSDVEKKEHIPLYLESFSYITVPATIVIEDYLYNMSLEKMGKMPDSADYFALMNEYINHILDEIVASENLSQQVLQRPCKQILKLRANRINAVFMDEILGAIKEMGYTFISVDKALKDKLYIRPEAYFGAHGLNYIQMIMESDPDHLPAE